MNDGSDYRLVRRLTVFTFTAAVFAVVAGLSGVVGWMLKIPSLTSWKATPVRIAANAAACFVLLGISLWLQARKDNQSFVRARKLVAKTAAAIVCVVSLISLAEHFLGWDLGIDQFLAVIPPAEQDAVIRPSLMSPVSAVDLVLLSSSLLLLDWKTRRKDWPAQYLCLGAAIGAIFGLCSLILEPHESRITVALPAAVTLLALACGVVCSRATWAIGGLLTSQSAGARLLRRVIPAALLFLCLTVWSISKTLLAEAHFTWVEASVLAILCGALLVGFVTWIAFIVDRSDALNARLERRVAERTAALSESEAKYRQIVDTAAEGIWVAGPDTANTFVNARMAEMLGYAGEEIVGKPLSAFMLEEDCLDREMEARKQGLSGHFERRLRRKDGQTIWVLVSATPILDDMGNSKGSFAMFTDITERKRAEEALRQSQERYRVFFEQNLAGNVITTPEGAILACNPAFVRMFGFASQEEAKQTNIRSLYASLGHREKFLSRLKERGHLESYEKEFRRRDGTPLYVTENVIGKFREGRLVEIHGFLIDETERRKTEQQLHQAQRMEAIGSLAGGIAHDFNNILSIIIGRGGLLLELPEIGESAQRHAEEIVNAGHRAASLTRQLLAFSRKQRLEPRVLNLNRVIEGIGKMINRVIGDDIKVETLLAGDLENVSADPGQMEQVILNFCVNARDAMPEGGRITIETHNVDDDEIVAARRLPMKPGRYVRLQVTDTGTGMDTETLSHIFEPFFTAKGLDKGTGLGLATVYGIVKQSGGYVWASSELGQGSVFSVYLPAVTEEEEPRALEAKPKQIMRGSGTILLVEDEAPLRELMREQLEGFGYNVLDAADAERADEIADRHDDIVLLLTDLSLPGIGGLTLAKSLREKKPRLKVLYMSAYADADALRGIQEGGGAFLQKPSTREELAQRLHSLLNSES